VGGDSRYTGVAGVVGVAATLGISFGLFWLLRKRTKQRT
jgi:cobalt/nickel transport protein